MHITCCFDCQSSPSEPSSSRRRVNTGTACVTDVVTCSIQISDRDQFQFNAKISNQYYCRDSDNTLQRLWQHSEFTRTLLTNAAILVSFTGIVWLIQCSCVELKLMLWTIVAAIHQNQSWQLHPNPNFGEDVVAGMMTIWIHSAWCHPKVRSDLNNVMAVIWERLQQDKPVSSQPQIQLPADEPIHRTSQATSLIHLT